MLEMLSGAGTVCLYFVIAASSMLAARWLIRIPDELFRKMLHFVLLGSYIPFISAFDTWWMAVLFAVIFECAVYPALKWAEHFRQFSSFVTERRGGEFKQSLLLAFTMLAVCMCVCWGWLGDRYLVLACMYAWGVGDAFAALVGKRFGRHKIHLKRADYHKSVEGSLAMFITSALTIFAVLVWRGGLSGTAFAVIPLAGAAAVTAVELYTPGGMDTVTCPCAAMAVMLPLMALFGGLA